MVGGEMI